MPGVLDLEINKQFTNLPHSLLSPAYLYFFNMNITNYNKSNCFIFITTDYYTNYHTQIIHWI